MRGRLSTPLALGAVALAALLGSAVSAGDSSNIFSGRTKLGEVWVYPSMFEQALTPLDRLHSAR